MGAPSAPVDICNLALDHLGQPPISSIDTPTTTPEETCARWYDHVRQTTLRKYVWNFAKRRASISRTGTPDFDWEDKYRLPNDCLRILSVQGDTEIAQEKEYDIEGKEILLNNGNAATAKLRYIADVTSPQQWDVLFRDIVALTLALKIAYKFTLKKGKVEELNQMLALEIGKAVSIDGQERPPKRIQRSRYHLARKMGGIGNVADQYTYLD